MNHETPLLCPFFVTGHNQPQDADDYTATTVYTLFLFRYSNHFHLYT